ncbi:MAG: PBP1A family penicillin-binding protein [Magnetospirillum sp.]|nr:PBP1A family penicillin-binding protein [Magnetospirillum sp.]
MVERPMTNASQPQPARQPPRGNAPHTAPRKAVWWKRLISWALTALIWVGIGVAGVIAYYAVDLPDIDQVTAAVRRPSVTFLSVEGDTFAAYGDIYGENLELAQIAPVLAQAVLATEDRRFYSHLGIDPVGLLRAVVSNLKAGRLVQGGSTITQQLAKNLFLKPDRTLKRKVQEVLMALWLEKRFTKEQILTLYLNRVYLGSGTFGVDAAAKRYFEKSARRVGLYEAALIAGLLKAPSRYSPLNDPQASHQRTVQVLQNMVAAGAIDQRAADFAALQGAAELVRRPMPAGRYFADWIVGQLAEIGDVLGRDVVVRTTLDLGLQRRAEAELKALLDREGGKSNVSQGAVVVMSPDGAVRALIGGKDYDDSQFNRATQATRQPGSSFKPFVYLTAMERGFAPADTMEDAPIKLGNWSPHNYNGKFEGRMTLHHAFAQSTNTIAVRLVDEVGAGRVINTAHRMGIGSDLRHDASIALGTSEVTLLELTAAYAPFANGGNGIAAFGIEEVSDAQGTVLWRRQGEGFGRIISPQALERMHELMSAVLTEGTGKAARLDRPAAGKTGTTQDYRDAWFMGFTADYVGGVWLGNDDQRNEMKKVTGGGLPAQLWKTVMLSAHRGLPPRPLTVPEPEAGIAAQGIEGTAGGLGQAAQEGIGLLEGLINSLFGR